MGHTFYPIFRGLLGTKPRCTVVKNLPVSAGDTRDPGLIPGLGRSPGVGNGNPFQYACLENSMDRGASGQLQPLESQRVRQD